MKTIDRLTDNVSVYTVIEKINAVFPDIYVDIDIKDRQEGLKYSKTIM